MITKKQELKKTRQVKECKTKHRPTLTLDKYSFDEVLHMTLLISNTNPEKN